MFARDFVRELPSFRAYRCDPALHLPTTTNVAEAMGNILRPHLRTLNTRRTLGHWATALIRLRPRMVCNGHRITPN